MKATYLKEKGSDLVSMGQNISHILIYYFIAIEKDEEFQK